MRNFILPDIAWQLAARVTVPATATAAGVVGAWALDTSYFYICVAPNTWRRVGIATW